MKSHILNLAMVSLLVVALLIGFYGMALANSVTWELDTAGGDGSISNPYEMNNSNNTKSESGGVTIGPGGTFYWQSDVAASIDTFFPVAAWSITVHLDQNPGANIGVTIGKYDPDTTTFDDINGSGGPISLNTWSPLSSQSTFTIPDVYDGIDHDPGMPGNQYGFVVSAGDYIMLKIHNSSETTSFYVSTSEGNQSTSHYPGTENPSWPVPEIITIVMPVLGVLALGGYIWVRRRHQSVKVAA